MLTLLNGSRRNHVANVKPVSWGHLQHYFSPGPNIIISTRHLYYIFRVMITMILMIAAVITILINIDADKHLERGGIMMALPAFPGKLKNTSGPDLYRRTCYLVLISFEEQFSVFKHDDHDAHLLGICRRTFKSFVEWRGHLPPTAFIAAKSSFSCRTCK